MSDGAPLWRYMRDCNLAVTDDVIHQLRQMFCESNPGVCTKNGKWFVETAALSDVAAFVMNATNVRVAEAKASGLMMGAGAAKARASRFYLELNFDGHTVPFGSPSAVQTFFDGLVQSNTEMSAKLAKLEKSPGSTSTAPVAVSSTPFPTITGGRVSVSGEKRHYKNAQSKKEAVLERIAQMVAEHPEVYLGVDKKIEVRRRTAAMANAMGFTTSQGKPWNAHNLANYAPELEKRIAEIIAERNAKFGKPRIRVSRAA